MAVDRSTAATLTAAALKTERKTQVIDKRNLYLAREGQYRRTIG